MPKAETKAWTNKPQQIPVLVESPSRHPPREALRTTNKESTPGTNVNKVMAIKNVQN